MIYLRFNPIFVSAAGFFGCYFPQFCATPAGQGLSNEQVLAGFDAAGASASTDEEPVAVPETEPVGEE